MATNNSNGGNNPNSLQYVSLDYAQYKDVLLQRIKSNWLLSWNDFLANNFGRILVDLIAWTMTTMAYLLNRVAAENFISTMTLRESAVRLGALVSYQLSNPVASTVLCEVELATAATSTVSLVQGTTIQVQTTLNGVLTFELNGNYTIQVGATAPSSLILTVSPTAVGSKSLNTTFVATAGSINLDLADSTVDLTAYVSIGQVVTQLGQNTEYVITDITSAPNAESNNRLILSEPWGSVTGAISAAITEQRVEFIQGLTVNENYTIPSSQQPNYSIQLAQQPVISDTVQVTIDGSVWNSVPTLALSAAQDQSFQVINQVDGTSAIIFGDGIFGAMPQASASILVTYRVGGGTAGNIDVGAVSATVVGQQVNGQTTVQVTNQSSPGEGGLDAETLAEARQNIPPFVRANDRAVTLADYQTLASNFKDPNYGQVTFATAFTNASNSLLEGNVVSLYAWTTGPSGGLIPLSTALKSSLLNYLQTKAIGTDYVVVLDGTQVSAPIAVRFKSQTGFSISDTETALTVVLSNAVTSLAPGQAISFSNLISSLNSTPGVASLSVATPLGDLNPLSTSQVFTPPSDAAEYAIPLTLKENFTYTGQLPVFPLAPWCFQITIGGVQAQIVPDVKTGFAKIIGDSSITGLADYAVGLAAGLVVPPLILNSFFFAADTDQLYRADARQTNSSTQVLFWNPVDDGGSYVNLNTGALVISFTGTSEPVVFNLITVQGYDSTNSVNLYISYSGNNSLVQRTAIRAALTSWAAGFNIGDSLFATPILSSTGALLIAASRSNVNDVVLSVPGVTGVNQVSLGSPSSSVTRVDVSATSLLTVGTITLNNQSN